VTFDHELAEQAAREAISAVLAGEVDKATDIIARLDTAERVAVKMAVRATDRAVNNPDRCPVDDRYVPGDAVDLSVDDDGQRWHESCRAYAQGRPGERWDR